MKEKQEKLINTLQQNGYIKSNSVKQAFLKTPRELFVPDSSKRLAYQDTPLDIGNEQTISAPHMVAIMCEALDVKRGQTILEIGAGSGYHAAVLSHMVGKTGHIYSVERLEVLGIQAKKNLCKAGIENVSIEIGDGSKGLPSHAPYDRIYVTCASPGIPPPLIDQLKDKGKLLIPVGNMYCTLMIIEKKGNETMSRSLGGCVFVPLIGEYGHQRL